MISVLFFLSAIPAYAVDLHYTSAKTYGAVRQQIVIEIPPDGTLATANEFYSLFAASKPYLRLRDPNASFLDTAGFSAYNAAAGGWYLTVSPTAGTLPAITAFASRTGHPVVVEVSPYDASFVNTLRAQAPSVKIHAGGYLFWPRADVKTVFSQTPPPAIEAVSIWVKETNPSDLFASSKLMFDTLFDATNDIAGGSGVKINYPRGAMISLSGIQPEMDDVKNTAFRMAVAGGAAVTYVQSQGKSGTAPIAYVGLGQYDGMSAGARIIVSRYAKFLSAQPAVVWPMAIAGNGDPYDNTFFFRQQFKTRHGGNRYRRREGRGNPRKRL